MLRASGITRVRYSLRTVAVTSAALALTSVRRDRLRRPHRIVRVADPLTQPRLVRRSGHRCGLQRDAGGRPADHDRDGDPVGLDRRRVGLRKSVLRRHHGPPDHDHERDQRCQGAVLRTGHRGPVPVADRAVRPARSDRPGRACGPATAACLERPLRGYGDDGPADQSGGHPRGAVRHRRTADQQHAADRARRCDLVRHHRDRSDRAAWPAPRHRQGHHRPLRPAARFQ